jgi:hypothetical protein
VVHCAPGQARLLRRPISGRAALINPEVKQSMLVAAHLRAAECHELAARAHRLAAECITGGDTLRAIEYTLAAQGHTETAAQHADHARAHKPEANSGANRFAAVK